MGKKQLADFLLRLSTDPSALQRYQQDPASAMAEAGLDTADRVALASGNADRLEAYLGEKPATIVKAAIVQGMGFATPIVQEPAIAPATPIVQQPIVKKPIVKKPIVKKPIVKKPIVKKPRVKAPAKKKTAKKAVKQAPAKKKTAKKSTTRIVKRTKVKRATKKSAKKSRAGKKPAARIVKRVKVRKSAKRRPARKK